MSCPACLDLLRFPVTLNCGHSVCKPCILGRNNQVGHIGITCPRCRTSSVVDNESDLKINAALQSAVDVMKGQAVPRIPCMRCETVEATVDCSECNAKYCSVCSDLVHVGRLKLHRLAYNVSAVQSTNKPPYCTQLGHEDYRTDLFCVDCKTLLCVVCSQVTTTHRSHTVVPLSEAADIERVKLRQTLGAAEKFRAELKHAVGRIDVATENHERSAQEEISMFDSCLAGLIQRLQEKRTALLENAKMLYEVEQAKLRHARDQLVTVASSLNDAMSTSQRALLLGTSTAIIRGCVEMEALLSRTDPVIIPDVRVPQFSFPHYQTLLASLETAAVSLSAQEQVHGQVLEASSVFTKKHFKFVKSTFNELQFLNQGLTVSSRPGSSWETAMCDQLISTGVTYVEFNIEKSDTSNGHNIVVGLVFDGGYELCEVIGEDTNSVGFDLGRGTKCVGGDYFLPYAVPCGQGDVVGMKIDFELRKVDFYRNGDALGTAFTGLTKPCYAAVSLINQQQVTMMFPTKVPF